ncbi:hydantoinase/oxoprolinase family protein [Croceicoccus ponticola]|uniref:Hydantoinase/oxoprolinase family protein n=1 Tax=Croceicoccus ponticola TaxID=2217664 RepID=A0A437GZJ5_9SPHN|nr:hydantoinase/oxoprolinase family protein [Croceicoccus ponticola]RVQ68791.1 hydantoinase/oxoprolinase family protein [Croceicoccus ponticola]
MRFATDTGGTFTDLVVEDDDGSITLHKASTVPSDPVSGVLDALTVAATARGLTLRDLLARADSFIHGTTHAINAIITGNAARTGLIVTQGHRDILLFREGGRTEPFNHTVAYPKAYVARALTFEAPERLLADGTVQTPLDEAAVVEILARMREQKVEAVAVALLWSTLHPAHELRIGELIERHLPGVPYSLSHKVNATLREFRRASSAAIDASLKPLMTRYLGSLSDRLAAEGFGGKVMVLTSAGGMVEAAEVAAAPIRIINSGPSMAPVAGRHYANREGGWRTAIVADTGGTTYDISLVSDGRVPMTRDLWIGEPYRGHLAGYPSVDVKSVGAGGGSIASLDAAGLLHVGPQSAGSTPGPACYGRGGTLPTVTDACMVLGYLDPDYFLGGAMTLDADASRTAIAENVADKLGMSVEDAAWSILDLATENMVQAIQELTVNQGIDPSDAVLIGGGGAAGLNSVFIARRLGCKRLLIPETGAAMSAAGAMISDITGEFAATVHTTTAAFDNDRVAAAIDRLRRDAEQFAQRTGTPGEIEFIAEARYEGQAWDIDVPLTSTNFATQQDIQAFRHAFDAMHEQIFTIRDPGSAVELIGLRARIRCPARADGAFLLKEDPEAATAMRKRPVYFAGEGWVDTQILRWDAVPTDTDFAGPALIESPFTTVVVDPAARFRRSAAGALLIEA